MPETPTGGGSRFLLPPLLPISQLSEAPCYYHTLNLDAMQHDDPFNTGQEEDYNTDDGKVGKFGGPHTCLAPTMSQDHTQLDSSLICKKNRESLPMMIVTHCDHRASVFSVEEIQHTKSGMHPAMSVTSRPAAVQREKYICASSADPQDNCCNNRNSPATAAISK
ncbi:hypothetical protein Ahy_A01g003697 [Arachis hypogaea]|uniref:Uncharacterized protein n=1 Tax=Arachis hypogaea TaxID=3818 RepID=A0A445ETK2_ARAHY|nr:hypothetical protein Ahy_A01g003697 [Arachis hypogaea]